jgi:hypothetical protein
MRRKRGSAILWVMMMVVSIAAIALVAAELGMSSIRDTIRYLDKASVDQAWQAMCSKIDADEAGGQLTTLPATYSLSMNGVTGTVNVADNSGQILNSNLVSATLTTTDGRSFVESSILSKEQIPNMFQYAIFSDSDATGGNAANTGSAGTLGDVFVIGSFSPNGSSIINGIAASTGTTTSNGATITGGTISGASAPCSWPTVNGATYLSASTTNYGSSQSFANYTFPTVSAGSSYPLVYIAGNLSIGGVITNTGTFYVTGTVSVTSNMSFANGNSHLAIITPNSMNITNNMVGYVYCGGTFLYGSSGVTVSPGSVAASAFNFKKSASTVLDPFVKSSSGNGTLMHLPGLWP